MTNTPLKIQLTICKPVIEYMHPDIVQILDGVPIPEELIQLGGELYLRNQGLEVPEIGVVVLGAFKNHQPCNSRLFGVAGYNQLVTVTPDQMPESFSSIFSQVVHNDTSNPVAISEDGRFVAYLN